MRQLIFTLLLLQHITGYSQHAPTVEALAKRADSIMQKIITSEIGKQKPYINYLADCFSMTFNPLNDSFTHLFDQAPVSRDMDAELLLDSLQAATANLFATKYISSYKNTRTADETAYMNFVNRHTCNCVQKYYKDTGYLEKTYNKITSCTQKLQYDTAYTKQKARCLQLVQPQAMGEMTKLITFALFGDCEAFRTLYFKSNIQNETTSIRYWMQGGRYFAGNYYKRLTGFYRQKKEDRLAEKFPAWAQYRLALDQLTAVDDARVYYEHNQLIKLAKGGWQWKMWIVTDESENNNRPAGYLSIFFDEFAAKPVIKSIRYEPAKKGDLLIPAQEWTKRQKALAAAPPPPPPPPPPPAGYVAKEEW